MRSVGFYKDRAILIMWGMQGEKAFKTEYPGAKYYEFNNWMEQAEDMLKYGATHPYGEKESSESSLATTP